MKFVISEDDKMEPVTVPPKMLGLNNINSIRRYCDYLEQHLINVGKAWIILQEKLQHDPIIYDDFDFWTTHALIEAHDLSKFSAEEFIQYAEWFYGNHNPEDKEHQRAKEEFDAAWDHHKQHNPHHWENISEKWIAQDILCMVADWMAMSMQFGGTAEEYYIRERGEIKLPDSAVIFMQDIFNKLREPIDNNPGGSKEQGKGE